MGKLAKVAIGCAVLLLLGGIALVAGIGGLVYWGKGKVKQVAQREQRIDALKRQAARAPFKPPADGAIAEDRLLKFLEVRQKVHASYEKHKPEIEAIRGKREAGLRELGAALGFVSEIREAQARALADAGMGEPEYLYLVQAVYRSAWASEVAKSTGGKSVSEAAGLAYEAATAQMEAQMAGLPPDARAKLEESLAQMRQQSEAVRAGARQMDVPPANLELFRKHEAEIKKYAMGGLEWLGL
jgi:hypothetical protein